ncbi:MAG: isoprenyl transferase [Dysgonamonadaceae bacterium]|jgi:undecaprenyl diphosphate synthase|nr:isoprenyl transferase [Dysgonamonadaceae bacterium]
MSLFDKIDSRRVPAHVAIIMDGNGRWAKSRGLERADGHREGVASVRKIVEAASKVGIKYLTVYAFSTENWKRPQSEVDALMDLMIYAIVKETPDLLKNGIRLLCIGDLNRLPDKTREALLECIDKTSGGNTSTLVLALSYSSRWEIAEAAKRIAEAACHRELDIESINESVFSEYLLTRNIPDPDLLIRTGGEQRISNFLLWQTAYAEFYFTDTFWPDFGEENLFEAIIEYQQRERRFGKTSEQIESEN